MTKPLLIVAWIALAGALTGTLLIATRMCSATTQAPTMRMQLHVESKDIPALAAILEHYAATEHLKYYDIGANMPPKDGRNIFYVIVGHESEGSKEVVAINIVKEDEVFLGFYEPIPDERYSIRTNNLIADLRSRWPDIHPYVGP